MIIEALAGSAGVVAGLLSGWFIVTHPRRETPKSLEPICGCDHHLAKHDPKTGECHEQIYRKGSFALDNRWERCPCRQYVGPKPADSFFTSDVAWDSAVMKAEGA